MRQILAFIITCTLTSYVVPSNAQEPFFVGPFDMWAPGWKGGYTPLKFEKEYVCVLTRVSGKFQGGGEQIKLELQGQKGDGLWTLSGSSQQTGVGAQGYCFRKDKFLASGDARWVSEEINVEFLNTGKSCRAQSADSWWGDAATYITGMHGYFAGGAEYVEIWQSSSGFTPSNLKSNTCQKSFVGGSAYAFFAGQPQTGHVSQFWGPNGKGSAKVAGDYAASTQGVQSVEMAPTQEAMCYFTRLTGKFNGGAEYAEISPTRNSQGVEVWTLRAHKGSGDGIWANARCFRRDQRG